MCFRNTSARATCTGIMCTYRIISGRKWVRHENLNFIHSILGTISDLATGISRGQRKIYLNEGKSGRKGKNREGFFTLPLLTCRAGYALENIRSKLYPNSRMDIVVASPICQEVPRKKTLLDLFSFFPIFPPLFPDFFAKFLLLGGALCPTLTPPLAMLLRMDATSGHNCACTLTIIFYFLAYFLEYTCKSICVSTLRNIKYTVITSIFEVG